MTSKVAVDVLTSTHNRDDTASNSWQGLVKKAMHPQQLHVGQVFHTIQLFSAFNQTCIELQHQVLSHLKSFSFIPSTKFKIILLNKVSVCTQHQSSHKLAALPDLHHHPAYFMHSAYCFVFTLDLNTPFHTPCIFLNIHHSINLSFNYFFTIPLSCRFPSSKSAISPVIHILKEGLKQMTQMHFLPLDNWLLKYSLLSSFLLLID